jgi:hypothetical protein
LKVLLLIIFLELLIKSSRQIDEKISLSKQLFLKYTLPPRGYQTGTTSLLYSQGMWSAWFPSKENTVSKAAYGKGWRVFGKIWACSRGRGEGTPVSI